MPALPLLRQGQQTHHLSSQAHMHSQNGFHTGVATLVAVSVSGGERAAAASLVQIIESLPLARMTHWEKVIRDAMDHARDGWCLWPSTLRAESADPHNVLTWLALSDGNGHVRERALRSLAGAASNGFFLSLAIRRLNDWVPEVRAAAREALPALVRAADPEYVADALCAMLPVWTWWGRMEAPDRANLIDLIAIDGVTHALWNRVVTSTTGPMPEVLSQSLRSPVMDPFLGDIALRAVQPVVRARAHRALLLGRAAWVQDAVWRWSDVRHCIGRLETVHGSRPLTAVPPLLASLQSAAEDRSASVRRVAAEVLVSEMDTLGSPALHWARRLADDVCPSIAERAAFVLKHLAPGAGPA